MKKIVSILIVIILVVSFSSSAFADSSSSSNARAVVGLDLNDTEIASVYSNFGIGRGTIPEFRMTNALEREYLNGFVDSSIIGTKSISCVYVELKNDGSGMDVSTNNVTWCTSEMYMSALATAGITDAKIIVTSPYAVSGTAALVGIYWAYEDITGQKLSDTAKMVSTQQLTVTGNLAEEIGNMNAVDIVDDLKLMLDETSTMTDEEIRNEINQIAAEYSVSLTDKQIEQLISLCRSLEAVKDDDSALTEKVKSVQSTLTKVQNASQKISGAVNTTKKVVESVKSFFGRIADIIGFDNSPV